MQQTLPYQMSATADFVSSYENAMREVIAGCGSRQAANSMIGELQHHYEHAASELKKAGDSPPARAEVLRSAKAEANRIIGKYAPNTGNHFHELVISYSFGAIMLTIPMVAAASLLGDGSASYREWLRKKILGLQEGMNAIERCRKPVIAAVHGH